MQKTLAMKLLEAKRIDYEARRYPTEIRDATLIAECFEVPPGRVLKTLVVPAPAGAPRSVKSMLVLVPADRQLDLKKLATTVKVKKLKMATHAEAEQMTGLQVGGISPLALLNRGFTVYVDRLAQEHERVFVSAGERGLNLELAVNDLVRLTKARLVDVSSET